MKLYISLSHQLKKLFTKIETDWITWSSKLEIQILRDYAEKGKNFRSKYFGKYDIKFIIQPFLAVFGIK